VDDGESSGVKRGREVGGGKGVTVNGRQGEGGDPSASAGWTGQGKGGEWRGGGGEVSDK
jgi:hypothetical protein